MNLIKETYPILLWFVRDKQTHSHAEVFAQTKPEALAEAAQLLGSPLSQLQAISHGEFA